MKLALRSWCLVAAVLAGAGTAWAAATPVKVALLVRADDPRLERNRVERAYLGHPGGPASEALQMAFKDAAYELDAAGLALALDVLPVADAAAARVAAQRADQSGAIALLTDLDATATLAVADAVQRPVLNVGAADDRLRERDCRARLWHALPSERMRSDALAQALVARRWTQLLLVVGPSETDAQRSATALASIKRYGLKLVASKPFKLSADPRERDLANPLLLTGNASYDVVWVVDSDGEFARGLPYRTALPRPVVGDAGLVALAWQAQFERYGAPQVSRRFAKATGRAMTAQDWAAWIAGKALVAAAIAARGKPAAAFEQALAGGTVDGSKGTAMGFRPWDGQLRQPLLLTDGVGVVGGAPADGVLHPKNTLDTLGADAPEKLCKARS
jgi:ABC transporter substrate binding protein (PQQ-dependent alcohol dehydrogenase system)